MRVIHIVHGKANPAGHNGISRVVYHLNRQERLQGCDSQIWGLVDGIRQHVTHRRDDIVSVECFPRLLNPFARHEIIERLEEQRFSVDLVHLHLIWFYDKNIIGQALKRLGIPFVVTSHGTYSKDHAYTGKRLLARWLYERAYLNMADEVHLITREEGTGMQKYGYTGKSFVAYNGIDLDEIPQERRRDFFDSKPYAGRVKLIWVGVLRDDKNLRSLIQAVAMLPAHIKATLVCVLVGPDYKGNTARYQALARELGCEENFDFLGPLYDQDKYDAIESADAYVMPSFSEVFSLAVLDALACGKPAVISSGCGFNYFAERQFFVACEPYPQDIAFAICKLLDSRHDWERMGRNARRLVEQELNWSSISAAMLRNYARITEAKRVE